MVTRGELRKLAKIRLADARALLAEGRYDGAYYLAGYAVECGLKACIARQTRRGEFPDKKRAQLVYTHELPELRKLAGLEPRFKADAATRPNLEVNWNTVKDWSEERRYTRSSKSEATDIVAAIHDDIDGVMTWIQARW